MSTNLTGNKLAAFAKTKLGVPYVYGAKGADGKLTQGKVDMLARLYPNIFTSTYLAKIKNKHLVGKVCCDCSGLISWYTGKVLGSSQLYSSASKRLPMSQIKQFPKGTVLWRSGHVAVYIGLDSSGRPVCIEEKGIDYGCVRTVITNPNSWSNGLLFKWMKYEDTPASKVPSGTAKGKNPYTEPTKNIKKGSTGSGAKWAQYELIEAGYGKSFTYAGKRYNAVKIDGEIGPISVAAIKAFQQSCKITADGIVGSVTRKKLIADR